MFKAIANAFSSAPGLGSLLGGTVAGLGSYFGQQQANQANTEMAREQMAFQERMSNTSYQRAITDMIAAGLNPMLAYSQGGASTPSGQTAVAQSALGAAANSATQAANSIADINLKTTQASTNASQEDLNRANQNLALIEGANKSAQLPGHQRYVDQVTSMINQNNAMAAQSSALAAKHTAELPESKAIGRLYEGNKGAYIKGAERLSPVVRDVGIGASSVGNLVTKGLSNPFRPYQPDSRPSSNRR
jgi:hypothetical protein